MDRAGRDFGSTGVLGVAGGVAVERRGGSGVVGKGGPGSRQRGGIGVLGFGGPGDGGFADGPGVLGQSNTAQGVIGVGAAPSSSGVSGFSSSTAGFATGVFGSCDAPGGAGVAGRNLNGDGVNGFSDGNIGGGGGSGAHMGVFGFGRHIGIQGQGGNAAILGFSPTGHGVIGIAPTRGKIRRILLGRCASHRHSDGILRREERRGSHRQERVPAALHHGKPGELVRGFRRGRATTGTRDRSNTYRLRATGTHGNYHVFITPYGDCGGLFVANRARTQFEVSELKGGKSNVRFSYRIIAKRKNIPGKRLERLRPPDMPDPQRPARKPSPSRENDARRMLRDLDLPAMRRAAARRRP